MIKGLHIRQVFNFRFNNSSRVAYLQGIYNSLKMDREKGLGNEIKYNDHLP